MKFRFSFNPKRQFFSLALIFCILLFENCTVYRSSTVELENAIQQNSKVILITESGEKLKFKALEKTDQNLVGVVKKRKTKSFLNELGFEHRKEGKFENYLIDALEIKEIHPQNKTASTLVSIGAAILAAATIAMIVATAVFLTGGLELGF